MRECCSAKPASALRRRALDLGAELLTSSLVRPSKEAGGITADGRRLPRGAGDRLAGASAGKLLSDSPLTPVRKTVG